jgi:hypothetical protein
MLRTVKATIDRKGNVKLSEAVALDGTRPALVTILDDSFTGGEVPNEAALLAESALHDGWSGPEEDEAWAHLKDLPDLDEEQK